MIYEIDKKDEISAVSSKKFLSVMDEVDGMHHLGMINAVLLCDLTLLLSNYVRLGLLHTQTDCLHI